MDKAKLEKMRNDLNEKLENIKITYYQFLGRKALLDELIEEETKNVNNKG